MYAAFDRHQITPGNHVKDRRSKIKTSEMHEGELNFISKYMSERSSVIKFMEDYFFVFFRICFQRFETFLNICFKMFQ